MGNVPFSITETILYSGVPNTPRMFAFQKVKTTSNTQVLSGRQSMNNHSSNGSPFSLSNKSHSCVLGGGFHWQLLDLPLLSSPNQKFCTVVADSDDGKETHAAELTLGHLFVPQKLASLRNLIMAQQMDKRRTERGKGEKHRKQKCTVLRRMPLFYFIIIPRKECTTHCSFVPSLENQEQGSGEARTLSVTLSCI